MGEGVFLFYQLPRATKETVSRQTNGSVPLIHHARYGGFSKGHLRPSLTQDPKKLTFYKATVLPHRWGTYCLAFFAWLPGHPSQTASFTFPGVHSQSEGVSH